MASEATCAKWGLVGRAHERPSAVSGRHGAATAARAAAGHNAFSFPPRTSARTASLASSNPTQQITKACAESSMPPTTRHVSSVFAHAATVAKGANHPTRRAAKRIQLRAQSHSRHNDNHHRCRNVRHSTQICTFAACTHTVACMQNMTTLIRGSTRREPAV